jgi:transposase
LRQAALTLEPVRWGVELLAAATLKQLPWPTQPLRVWTQDESRFGLITVLRRRLTLRGVKPRAPYQHERQSFLLYGNVEPLTGESFFLELPGLDTPLFQLFLNHFAQEAADALNLVVLDQASAHIALELRRPANVRFVFAPPYTPEVNPIERLWEDLHAKLAGYNPPSLNALSDSVCEQIQAYTPAQLSSLTSYPFFKNAANAVCSM